MKTLIVDRVKVFQQLIAGILNDSSIQYAFSSTGKEAMAVLEKEHFDCICLALYLDDIDGIELCKKIRSLPQNRYTPIVLLTSESSNDVIRSAIKNGITDIFLKKNVNELVNFIKRFTKINKPLSGRVLYIEDQRSQRELVTRMFSERKLEVDAFETAEEAWQAFLKNNYQLVVTDIVLAGEVSGVLLINKIRRLDGHKGDTPILAITAFDDSSRRISLYHMGISDYVTKPIIEEELIARVRNLINNQKALEREQQFREHLSSEETVRRSMKMEAMGKLTGGIAHDYNNMLSVIMGYTDLLKRGLGEQQQKLLEYIQQIDKACKNGASLTGKLMAFTRKKAARAEIVNLNQLITETEPMLEKLLTASIGITLKLENEIWNVKIDSNDLENALMNLAINAKHAIGQKGELTIVSSNKKLSREQADQLGLMAGEYVRLSVLDSGCGMDEETQTRIFDPFYTTKGDAGTGLGLSQVYGFVQRSKGAIGVESKMGKGTLFNLYFPREIKALSQVSSEKQEKSAHNGRASGRILVVDDEESLADLNAEILRSAGYDVSVANNGDDAIEQCTKKNFDLVFTDVIMPGLNGYELTEKVKSMDPQVKIIVTSGYDESVTVTESQQSLFETHLDKPVGRDRLLNTVAGALGNC